MDSSIPASQARRTNSALWIGLIFLVLTFFSNFPVLYASAFGQTVMPWVNLLLPVLALIFCFVGLKRAFGDPQIFRGKIGGSILTVLSVLFVAFSVWLFVHARAVPSASHAPQVGQKAPDFTLTDTSGQTVTLSQLISTPIDAGSSKAPKALLLVFYRGFW